MCLVDSVTKASLDIALQMDTAQRQSILTYGVGGQYAQDLAGFKYGLQLYSLESGSSGTTPSFARRKHLVDGNHKGCLELRSKFKGVGEFDGQPALTFFKDQWFLYARANCHADKGCRQVQACHGESLELMSEFKYVSFSGVPIDADIYFVHVYRTNHGTLAAVFPMAEAAKSGRPTLGGIYIAESDNGMDFGPPVPLYRSPVFLRRTFHVPVSFPNISLQKGSSFTLPLHLDVTSRMPEDFPGNQRFKWFQFQ